MPFVVTNRYLSGSEAVKGGLLLNAIEIHSKRLNVSFSSMS